MEEDWYDSFLNAFNYTSLEAPVAPMPCRVCDVSGLCQSARRSNRSLPQMKLQSPPPPRKDG